MSDTQSFEIAAGGEECRCPKCGADLRDGLIPAESFHLYGYADAPQPVTCRYGCGSPPHFSKLGSSVDQWADRATTNWCPACRSSWRRS